MHLDWRCRKVQARTKQSREGNDKARPCSRHRACRDFRASTLAHAPQRRRVRPPENKARPLFEQTRSTYQLLCHFERSREVAFFKLSSDNRRWSRMVLIEKIVT